LEVPVLCPQCGSEYREGFRECANCKVPLIDERLSATPYPSLMRGAVPLAPDTAEPVVVFRSNDVMVISIAESILRSAEIEFMTRGRDIQGLFGWGGFPMGTSLAMGPMEILCRGEDSVDATRLLANLASGSDAYALTEDRDPDGEP
jgi:hypothetical protein